MANVREYESDGMDVACPVCGYPPGDPCRWPRGRRKTHQTRKRWSEWKASGSESYSEFEWGTYRRKC
jgi:hypothetical protein